MAHIAFADPVCGELASVVDAACKKAGVAGKRGGTYLCMEGPQFSTKAESNVYRSLGMDVIGMTNLQEAKLAREAELCYVTVAMVTDYDCWHPHHDSVTVDQIVAVLLKNAENAARVVRETVAAMPRRALMQVRIGAGTCDSHRSKENPRRNKEAVESDFGEICEIRSPLTTGSLIPKQEGKNKNECSRGWIGCVRRCRLPPRAASRIFSAVQPRILPSQQVILPRYSWLRWWEKISARRKNGSFRTQNGY